MELTNVLIFLKAKTKEELVELQVLNNHINHMHFNYVAPIWDGKEFSIWFFADITEWIDPKSITGDALKIAKGEL